MPTFTDDEWAAIAAQITHLESEVDYLRRERLLYREGRESLERSGNQPDLLAPCPPGFSRGHSGQLYAVTYEAGQEMAPNWFKPTPRKTTRMPD